MELNLSQEQTDALKRLLYDRVESASMSVQAVYIPPAAQLRQRADKIEQDERDTPLLKEVLQALKNSPL